jgi:hypothetical protein
VKSCAALRRSGSITSTSRTARLGSRSFDIRSVCQKAKHFCARATETNLVERQDRIAAVRAASKEQAGDLLELFIDRRTQEVQAD